MLVGEFSECFTFSSYLNYVMHSNYLSSKRAYNCECFNYKFAKYFAFLIQKYYFEYHLCMVLHFKPIFGHYLF